MVTTVAATINRAAYLASAWRVNDAAISQNGRPTGNMLTDENGIEYPEMAAIPGYHVNFLGDLPAIPSAYIVTPLNPVRIFAGVEA